MTGSEKSLDLADFSTQKLSAVLHQIELVKASDFPHPGGEEALSLLSEVFNQDLDRLNKLPPNASDDTKRATCLQVNHNIARFLPILGFILRSTNVRNSFEFFEPLLRLAKQILGEDARLIFSAEWDYSPLTYALVFDELPNFVFIGLPSSEAGNALIIPLSGHELGHSIWQRRNLLKPTIDILYPLVVDEYRRRWADFESLLGQQHDPANLETDLFLSEFWSKSLTYAVRQSEEVFCDLTGVRLFGRSYLHAFEYLLAPSTGAKRQPYYPDIEKRAQLMAEALERTGLDAPKQFAERFEELTPVINPLDEFMLEIADTSVSNISEWLFDQVNDIADDANVTRPAEREPEEALKRFKLGIPGEKIKDISEIIDAGWLAYIDPKLWDSDPTTKKRKFYLLNELILKTIEVYELEQRVKG